MAHADWDSIDNLNYDFEEHYCAFLDMLGYKHKQTLFFQKKYNLYGRVQRAMYNAGVELTPQSSPDGITTRIFSDSIILTVNRKNTHIGVMLNYIALLVTNFGYEGLFLRGGLSFGKLKENIGTNDNYSFLASEGLVKAYQMEMQAIYPMIMIDEKLISEFDDLKYVVKYGNSYMLNYARFIINEQATNENDVIKELEDIINLKNQLTDSHIKEKYEWIINYYLWFVFESNQKYNKFNLIQFKQFEKEINDKHVFVSMK